MTHPTDMTTDVATEMTADVAVDAEGSARPRCAWQGSAEHKARALAALDATVPMPDDDPGHWRHCTLGCPYAGDHRQAAKDGIPEALVDLADMAFEDLDSAGQVAWHRRWPAAIVPGADLSLVVPRALGWVLGDPQHGVLQYAGRGASWRSAHGVLALFHRLLAGDPPKDSEWAAARGAAQRQRLAAGGDAGGGILHAVARAAGDAADDPNRWSSGDDAVWAGARAAALDALRRDRTADRALARAAYLAAFREALVGFIAAAAVP